MRSAAQIKDFIIKKVGEKSALSVLAANPNPNALWKQFIECIANVMVSGDQAAADHVARIEAVLIGAKPHTREWVLTKALQFQYDAESPQVLTTIDGIIQFETTDDSKKIITSCAVRTNSGRQVDIIAGKSSGVKLSDLELDAFANYMNDLLSTSFNLCGVFANCVTHDPDYCTIKGEVIYNGLYSATISSNVTEAIENYLLNLGVTGYVSPNALRDVVMGVAGVLDFIIEDMAIRANAAAFSTRTKMIDAFTDNGLIAQPTAAGYAYTEIEPGETLDESLTFTAQ